MAGGGLWAPQRRLLTAGLAATITFVAAEALAVVTVMPLVARDLHGLSLYGFVFSSFMLGTMIGIVAAGRVADRRGPAAPYIAGLVLFASGLAIAGLAPSMLVLIAGRTLQGIGVVSETRHQVSFINIDPSSTAKYFDDAFFRTFRVPEWTDAVIVPLVPVIRPFPNVADHIEQAVTVRRILGDLRWSFRSRICRWFSTTASVRDGCGWRRVAC